MTKKTHAELLAELLKKQESLQNRIASIEARKRKDDDRIMTRKKILIGAYIIEKTKDNNNEYKKIVSEMDTFLKRPNDRKLFGFTVSQND
jgi:hypothetical protein